MRSFALLLLCLAALLVPAAASAACTYPQGYVGTSVSESGFITSWTRNPTPDAHGKYSKFDVTFTYTDPQYGSISGSIDWGDNNVNIQGPGWNGAKILTTRMIQSTALGPHTDPAACDYGASPIKWCWLLNENTAAFMFDTSQTAAVIVLGGNTQTIHHGDGITKLRGMGLSGDPKKMWMYSFSNHVVQHDAHAAMTTVGCTAALAVQRDWRWAFAAPRHPDALTIEALLFG